MYDSLWMKNKWSKCICQVPIHIVNTNCWVLLFFVCRLTDTFCYFVLYLCSTLYLQYNWLEFEYFSVGFKKKYATEYAYL